jgi:hypothetical protein
MSHPDYVMQKGGEFHDNVSALEQIEQLVKNSISDDVSKSDFEECPECKSEDIEAA